MPNIDKIIRESINKVVEEAIYTPIRNTRELKNDINIYAIQLPNGDLEFKDNDAYKVQSASGCKVLKTNDGHAVCYVSKDKVDLVYPKLVRKGYSIQVGNERQYPKYGERPSMSDDKTVFMDRKNNRRQFSIEDRIRVKEQSIERLKKEIPMEEYFYNRWQEAIGTPEEEKYRQRYETYYYRHEDLIMQLQAEEYELDKLKSMASAKTIAMS